MSREQKVAIANPNPQKLPGPQLLHDLALGRHEESQSCAIDFLSADGSRSHLTYSELNQRSDQLAAALLRRFEDRCISNKEHIIVPVFMPQSLHLYISLLAILKAGAGFCPQALDAPADRLKFVFKDVDAMVVLSTTEHQHLLPQIDGLDTICVDQQLHTDLPFGRRRDVTPRSLAYVLYTSGSTGTPKGVVLSHLAVTQSLLAHDPVIPPFSRFLQFASPTFDVSMFEIFFTLFRGSTLVACDRRKLLNDLPGVLHEMQVDGAELTPTVAGSLLGNRDQVPILKVLLTIGEMLTRHVIDEFGAADDKQGLLQGMYGPTEAAIHCTLQTDFRTGDKPGIIGIPLCTVSALIIAGSAECENDPSKIKILNVGEIGELALGGYQLADGYLNRPEQTTATFIPTEDYGMLYRTGDKARLLEDGRLECLGRISSGQVKLRGMRMELGEIEHAATTTKGCRVAVASVLNQNLVLFCLTDHSVEQQTIVDACKKWLPPYMLPHAIILTQELPQLPSGKIDRKKLESQYLDSNREETGPPEKDLSREEQDVSRAIRSVLEVEVALGTRLVHTNLDSLSAIRVASQLREKGYDVDAVKILNAGTLKDLARSLKLVSSSGAGDKHNSESSSQEKLVKALSAHPQLNSQQDRIEHIIPCTPLQASMLAQTKYQPDAYCNWIKIAFHQSISKAQIRDAFLALFRENGILRSGFITAEGLAYGFAQVIFDNRVLPNVDYVDELSYTFSMTRDQDFLNPLKVQVREGIALLHLHHSLYDGWSIDLLLADFDKILRTGAESTSSRPQFSKVTEYYERLSSSSQELDKSYWKSMLRGYKPLYVPKMTQTDTLLPTLSLLRHVSSLSDVDIRASLPLGCHPQVLFQGGLAYLLSGYLGSQDIAFGTVVSGRTIPVTGIENIIGPCINTLPLRTTVEGASNARELLQTLLRSNRTMLEHSKTPLQQIKTFAEIEPGQPFLDVLFVWQESLLSGSRKDSMAEVVESRDFSEFSLVLEIEPHLQGLGLTLRYRESLWALEHAKTFLMQLDAIVQLMLSNLDTSFRSLAFKLPGTALSFNEGDTTIKYDEVHVLSLVPQHATASLVHHGQGTAKPVLRGFVGEIYWTGDDISANGGIDLDPKGLGSFVATGHFGRMLTDGSIILVDHLAKEKTTNITNQELKEIESAAETFPYSMDSFIPLIYANDEETCLITFWVPQDSSQDKVGAIELDSRIKVLIGRLYDHLLTKLPQNLVPRYLIPVYRESAQRGPESLLSVVSQLDIAYMQSVRQSQFESFAADEWSDTELTIATAVARVTGAPSNNIKLRTSFFSLGVNSITAVSLARSLEGDLNIKIEASDIFRHSTVSRLAVAILDKNESCVSGTLLELDDIFTQDTRRQINLTLKERAFTVQKIRPCTPLQEAMLYAETSADKSAYLNHTLFSLSLKQETFMAAFRQCCSRHEILRTCFFTTDHPRYAFAQVVLCTYEPSFVTTSESPELFMDRAIQAIDAQEPPFSITFFEGENLHLLLSMHHALYDGQAIDVLLHEIEMICSGIELPPAPSYDDFLRMSLAYDVEASNIFWSHQLSGYIAAPILQNSDNESSKGMDVVSHPLQVKLSQLETAAKQYQSTALSICQAAWARTLSIVTDEHDVCFGNVVSGRTVALQDIDRLVAPCFNTLPVRLNLSKFETSEQLLKELHTFNANSLEHQFTPLRRIQGQWTTSGERLIDTLFLLQNPSRVLDSSVWTIRKDVGDMGFPMVCEVVPGSEENGLLLNLHFELATLSKQRAEQLWSLYQHLLERLVGLHDGQKRVIDLFPDLMDEIKTAKLKSLQAMEQPSKTEPDRVIRTSPSGLDSRSDMIRPLPQNQSSISPVKTLDQPEVLTQMELVVRNILEKIVQTHNKNISRTCTIYQLGLDSISAIQIARALRAEKFAVNAEDVLANPTIGSLGSILSEKAFTHEEDKKKVFNFSAFQNEHQDQLCQSLTCSSKDIKWIIPCTAVQSGMIAQCHHTDGTVYINGWTFKLQDDTDVDRLQIAWRQTAKWHDLLRTVFVQTSSSEHPFAAMCHRKPFESTFSSAKTQVGSQKAIHERAIQSILNDKFEPAWRVCIFNDGDQQWMHLTALHALFDAKSLSIIFDDLWRAYSGESYSASSEDVRAAASIMLMGGSDEDGKHKEFWVQHLGNASPCRFPNLTTHRRNDRTMRKSRREFSYNQASVSQACQNHNITLQAALQSSFTLLLSDYTGEAEVTFGVVLSGREAEVTHNVAFPTAVTLPFHSVCFEDTKDLLDHSMNFNGSVRKHQFSPLTNIQRWVGASNSALFDCLLVLQDASQLSCDGCILVDEKSTAEYSMSLEVTPKAGRLELSLAFWDDIIPEQHANIILKHFDFHLSDILQMKNAALEDCMLSIQGPSHPSLDTQVTYMHEFVEMTARNTPNRPALEFNWELESASKRKIWTYADLDVQGNKVANYLISQGQHAGSIIAICFDKCPEASFATYGILKSGSAFVAIDHRAPIARKTFIIDDSKASAILTTSDLAMELRRTTAVPVIAFDEIDLSSFPSTRPYIEDQINQDSTCYCLYTSGSTGTPKGCLISHYNAVQGLLAFQRIFNDRYTANSRWLQFAAFHFDVSVLEQFWSWMVGICVVSAPRDVIFEDLAGALNQLKITHLDLTPSLARLITPREVPSLCEGVFITGGEQLRQEVLDAWGDTGVIHNFYGPSECTIGVTVNPQVGSDGKPTNIGKQFVNVGSYVFKPGTTDPVATGGPGELCISGPLVGKGYLNRPELTAERFPYVDRFKERIYRTGDLVRVLYDGSFDFLGRIDDQVKLRGQRLELGEINNAVLESSMYVKDCHTMVMKDRIRQIEQIVSFVVLDSRQVLDSASHGTSERTIMDGCSRRLPPYMVPSKIYWVEESLPLTRNNKVDAKALSAIFDASSKHPSNNTSDNEVDTKIRSPQQHAIANALANFLRIDKSSIGGATNLFQAGLDSISVFNFVQVLRKAGFQKASTYAVMKSSSVLELAEKLGSNKDDYESSVLDARQMMNACQQRYMSHIARSLCVDRSTIESIAPCTPLQQGMIARLLEKAGVYFTTFAFELSSNVDIRRLQSAWITLIKRVPMLRTEFVDTDEGHLQVVLEFNDLAVQDIVRIDDTESGDSVLTKPLRVILGKSHMTIKIFHALYDAISLQLILEELASIYLRNALQSTPSFLDALPYGPLKKDARSRSFWIRHLTSAQFSTLPASVGPSNEKVQSESLTLDHLDGLDKVRRNLRVTHQALVQACWVAVLQSYIRAPTTIGLVISGRSIDFDNSDRIIGPMFNTLPFFAGFDIEDTFATAVKKCHDYNVEALPHQHTALHDISKWTYQPGRQNLFDTLFVFQKAHNSSLTDSQSLWKQIYGRAAADYPLAFEVEQTAEATLQLRVVALASVAENGMATKLLQNFAGLFEIFLKDPNKLLRDTLGQDFVESCSYASTPQMLPLEEISDVPTDWTDANPLQRIIASEIATLAGVDMSTLTLETSMASLGLDSIDAIKLSSRAKAHKLHLPVSTIMRAQTVASLAEQGNMATDGRSLEADQTPWYRNLVIALRKYASDHVDEPSRIESVFPVTPLQEAMTAEMYSTGHENYFNHDVLELSSGVDKDRLKMAWHAVIKANPVLRTSFLEIEDPSVAASFAQIVWKDTNDLWTSRETQETESENTSFKEYFDHHRISVLTSKYSPPLRLTSLEFPSGKAFYIFSIAHSLYDGFSLGLLHEDVQKAYNGLIPSRPSYEPILAQIISASDPQSEAFWKNSLFDATPCRFPELAKSCHVYRSEMSSRTALAKVQSFCKDHRVTAQALAYTCWSFVLATYTSRLDTISGLVLSGREDETSQKILFPTMNTIAMRSIMHGTRSEMIQYNQSCLAEILSYQHFPLRKVLALNNTRELFNSIFIFQKRANSAEVEREKIYKSLGGDSSLDFPIAVEMEVLTDTMVWRAACSGEYLSESDTNELLEMLDVVLERIMDHPEAAALSYNEMGTSICELPSFHATPSMLQASPSLNGSFSEAGREVKTATEKIICEVLSALSGVATSEISKDHTLFHLGLDSISAIKVSSIMRKKGLKIKVSEMLRAGTVSKIAEKIKSADETNEPTHRVQYRPRDTIHGYSQQINRQHIAQVVGVLETDIEEILPATPGQTYMLSMWINSHGALFYPTFEYQLSNAKSPSVVRMAWQKLVASTAILRTSLVSATTSDQLADFVQVVFKSDLETQAKIYPMHSMNAIEADKGVKISLRIHHALYDAVSLHLLMEQLCQLCENIEHELPWTPSTSSLAPLIPKKSSEHNNEVQNSFWKEYLWGASSMPTSITAPKSDFLPRLATYTPGLLPYATCTRIISLARSEGLSVQSIFLAVVAKLYASQDAAASQHLVIGVYLANRSTEETASLPAPTLNLLPIVARNAVTTSTYKLAKQMQDDLHRIASDGEASSIRLADIIDRMPEVFVNFLPLPTISSASGETPDLATASAITFEQLGAGETEITSASTQDQIRSLSSDDRHHMEALGSTKIAGRYSPHIDIEAAIRSDSGLDVGIFGSEGLLSTSDTKKLLEGIEHHLGRLTSA